MVDVTGEVEGVVELHVVLVVVPMEMVPPGVSHPHLHVLIHLTPAAAAVVGMFHEGCVGGMGLGARDGPEVG
jgi:hypothetical protein